MCAGEADARRTVALVTRGYEQLLDHGVLLQRQVEAYYLREEAYIRQRVLLLDELQAVIAEERRCLERQHHECRVQIRNTRRGAAQLLSEQGKLRTLLASAHAHIARDEAQAHDRLCAAQHDAAEADMQLCQLRDARAALAAEEDALDADERHVSCEEHELQRATSEMDRLEGEVERRRVSLEQKRQTMTEWDRALEARERALVRRQHEVCADLQRVELDESRLGMPRGGVVCSTTMAPALSRREVMDDHDMSIEYEGRCEEIDRDDDDDDDGDDDD